MNHDDYRMLDGAVSDAYACLDHLTSLLDKLIFVRRDAVRELGGSATPDEDPDREPARRSVIKYGGGSPCK